MKELFRDPVGVLKSAFQGFQRDDGTGVAAESAYRLVFALPALTIFFASLSAMAAEYTGVDAFEMLLTRAEEAMPAEVYGTLEMVFSTVEEQSGIGVLSIGLVLALWSGSNAIAALVKAINSAYGMLEGRGFVKQRLLALGLTLGLSLLMITAMVLVIFGQTIGESIADTVGMGNAFTLAWNIARLPVILVLFMAALAMLYRFAPAEKVTTSSIVPGAIVATILWVIASYLFNLYLTFSDPGSAYGVLGGILVLLLFLYLSSIVMIVGAEINAVLLERMLGIGLHAARAQHPVDILGNAVDVHPAAGMGGKIATWALLATMFAGGVLGSLLRRKGE